MNNEEKYSILFLDIDGIITTPATRWRDFDLECVKNLKYIIKETDCKIVLHSTWRNLPENRKRFFYLFKKYNEIPLYIKNKWGEYILDCYGIHSKSLKEKSEKGQTK